MSEKCFLGIELGSTRIKSVLIGEDFSTVASGAHEWENSLENGFWTYSLDDVWHGIRESLKTIPLEKVTGLGVSAMMHGYLAFDSRGELLVPFRTWRNTTTEKAASELTAAFEFNIPQRWSIAHLWQAMLDKEPHVKEIAFMTTLAGYVHWRLTGEKVLGVGDASGMFPVENGEYNPKMREIFREKSGVDIAEIFPRILNAGEAAGVLTEEGARLLGVPEGTWQWESDSASREREASDTCPRNRLCAPRTCPAEGDAGTGMVATNAVRERTGNISAGTSVFAMIVLERALKNVHVEIDMVVTPAGKPVAMVHCNNCSSDIDAWVRLLGEFLGEFGEKPSKPALYEKFYKAAMNGDADCGGLLAYNYFSGEPIVELDEGRPMFMRLADANFSFGNFSRTLIFSALATLRLGMEILRGEDVLLEKLQAHGGIFKTPQVAQKLLAAALNTPVAVSESAAEGGAWGIAILAAFSQSGEKNLENFLEREVFKSEKISVEAPEKSDVDGFEKFLARYKSGLKIQKSATENFK